MGGELNAIGLMNTVVSLFPPPLRVPVMLMLHVTEREEAELSGKKWEMGGGGGGGTFQVQEDPLYSFRVSALQPRRCCKRCI